MPSPPLSPGRLLDGRYRVVRHVADGGMGAVYLATDTRLDRDVALKVLREDLARDPGCVERFRKEARAAARLSHPGVVGVHDQGQDDGVVFLVMEFVDGTTLRALLDSGPLTVERSLDLADAVLDALAAAHRAGIVHRDVKPENVLVGVDGTVKVADFGLARAVGTQTMTTGLGGVLGTVSYLAPEQVERGVADARSDVYAAGLVLHEMLTGRIAVSGDSPIHVAYQHVHADVPPPSQRASSCPAALDPVVVAATRRDPDERPRDAVDLRERLRRARTDLPPAQLAARPSPPPTATGRTDTDRVSLQTRPWAFPEGDDVRGGSTAATEGSSRARRPRRRVLAIVAGLALALVLASAWFFGLGPGSARDVPDVTGGERVQAAQQVQDAGFRVGVAEEFSETVPAGSVVATRPAPGSSAYRWSAVTLVVSRGPERHDVPRVAGSAPDAAAQAISGAKLSVGRTTRGYSETVPAGQVSSTSPKEGASLPPGSTVDLVVSSGREPIELPDLTGRSLQQVRDRFADKQVTVEVTGREFSSSVPEGSVVSQQPKPTTIHRGDTVRVVLSKGPDLVTVPTVRGMDEDEATAALRSAGFEVEVSKIAGGLFGTAHSTDPEAGGRAPRGSTVTLRIV